MIRKRLPAWQAVLVVLVPLLFYGAVNTGYTLTKLSGEYSGEPASHPRELTSIDRTSRAMPRSGLVLAPTSLAAQKDPFDTYWTWWQPSFWNETVQRDFVFPGGDTVAQGFATRRFTRTWHTGGSTASTVAIIWSSWPAILASVYARR